MAISNKLYKAIVDIVEDKVKDIKVQREDFTALKNALEELALAQARTEERLGLLSQRVEELALAQARTEESLKYLSQAVGSLSDTIGFGIEDVARVVLPGYLYRHLGITVDDLERRFFQIDGYEVEINLYGEGKRGGDIIKVFGECKSRIKRAEVEKFIETLSYLKLSDRKDILKVMFGFYIHPSANFLASQNDILLVASYQR